MWNIAFGIVLGVILLFALVYAAGWLGFWTWIAVGMFKPSTPITPRKHATPIDMYGDPL